MNDISKCPNCGSYVNENPINKRVSCCACPYRNIDAEAHNTLCADIDKGRSRSVANQALCLEWREIENPCKKCAGRGHHSYPNTTTWHGGIGGQSFTNDVCDRCWGSGSEDNKWVDLRKVKADIEKGQRYDKDIGLLKAEIDDWESSIPGEVKQHLEKAKVRIKELEKLLDNNGIKY